MIHITNHTSGKLQGIVSINGNPLYNSFCRRQYQNKKSICYYCYATHALKSYRQNCSQPYLQNDQILSKIIIPRELLPVYNYKFIRIHSFGELINKTHLLNYCNLAQQNSHSIFVLMTKRKDIVYQIKNIPSNIILIYSNPIMDTIISPPAGFHKTFNVIHKNQVSTNCKGQCIACLKCYSKKTTKKLIEHIKQISWKHYTRDEL